jgi:hypothetical protein
LATQPWSDIQHIKSRDPAYLDIILSRQQISISFKTSHSKIKSSPSTPAIMNNLGMGGNQQGMGMGGNPSGQREDYLDKGTCIFKIPTKLLRPSADSS